MRNIPFCSTFRKFQNAILQCSPDSCVFTGEMSYLFLASGVPLEFRREFAAVLLDPLNGVPFGVHGNEDRLEWNMVVGRIALYQVHYLSLVDC